MGRTRRATNLEGEAAHAGRSITRRVMRRAGLTPRPPRGWVAGPPDFVGVGAQRSGTKWWYRLVCEHPGVHPGRGKELHFFDRYAGQELSDRDIEAYHRLFPRPPRALTGEWTPRYMHDFWTPGLLARAAPEARILVLVRDPWERYVSGLGHETRVLRRELRRGRREYLRAMIASDALSRSLYSRQLSALFEHFDRSQVLVLQYELCVDDPARELRRTYEFLGVDPDHVPASVNRRIGRSSPRIELPDHVAREAAMAIARDALRLGELVPEIELALWPSCRNRHPAGRSEGNGERAAEAALP